MKTMQEMAEEATNEIDRLEHKRKRQILRMQLMQLWGAYQVTSEEHDKLDELIGSPDPESINLAGEMMNVFHNQRQRGHFRLIRKE